MRRFQVFLALAGMALATAVLPFESTAAQSADDRPWMLPDSILILDPYESNAVDWKKVATDRKVKAMIHRAFFGLKPDKKYEARVKEARAAGLFAGLYLLGRPGDPIKQADALIDAGKRTGVKFLALDIENLDPKLSMSIPDAARFIAHVQKVTGRYPALYVNFSTYRHISERHGKNSVFAKAPLWLARFGPRHGMIGDAVWPTYTIWQFQSEINCKPAQQCFHRVPGTASDMDVNVFRGTEAELKALFQ
jgi:GH25 family lysozyme M1 (1,4-beta-N-acetylmuramidase)